MHGGSWGAWAEASAWKGMGVWSHQAQEPGACTALSGSLCPLEPSCVAMRGEHMEAQPPMGRKGGSGEGGE